MKTEAQCRICLGPHPLKDVFESKIKCKGASVTCHDVMTKLLSLSVIAGDGLPRRVCRKCHSKLSNAYKLKNLADRSYLILLDSILKNDNKSSFDNETDERLPYDAEDNTFDTNCDAVRIKVENKDDEPEGDVPNSSLYAEDFDNTPLSELIKKEYEPLGLSTDTRTLNGKKKKKKKRHYKSHKNDEDENSIFKANVCFVKREGDSQVLVDDESQGEKVYMCKMCPKSYKSSIQHYKHVYTTHRTDPYYCEICKKYYKQGDFHVRWKHSNVIKNHECPKCPSKFRTRQMLKMHMLAHTDDKQFLCSVCGKGFKTKAICTTHRKRIHDKERPFVCHHCSKSYFSKEQLEDHIRSHTKEFIHKCNECNKLFANYHSLGIHKKLHMGVKSAKCMLCEKAFFTNSALQRHMLVHTKEKKYECKYCGLKFARRDHTTKHERNVHQNLGPIGKSEPYFMNLNE